MKSITLNLGCAGPRRNEYVGAAREWVDVVRCEGFDIVFAQELPDDAWLRSWQPDYDTFEGEGPQYRARSAVVVRRSLGATKLTLDTGSYHGSYVAGARLRGAVLLSIHASPTVVTERYLEQWPRRVPTPSPRYPGQLWDADMAL